LEGDKEVIELYQRYHAERHGPSGLSGDSFRMFLGSSPIRSELVRYRVEDRLVGLGWIDILPEGLSTVYFAFDPEESQRSLGTFSIMTEIKIAASLGKQWYYLGFYVPGSPKMDYKANFRPHQLLIDGRWQEQA
jgi:arginine-tRNA-protein transferase